MVNIKQETKIWKKLILFSIILLIVPLFLCYKQTLICNNNVCVQQSYYFYKNNIKVEINRNAKAEIIKGVHLSKSPCMNYSVEPFFTESFCSEYAATNAIKKIKSSNNIKITHIHYLSVALYIGVLFILLCFKYIRKKYSILINMAYMDIFILVDIILLLYLFFS